MMATDKNHNRRANSRGKRTNTPRDARVDRGRLWPLFILFSFLLILLGVKLVYVQIFKHSEYANAAREQRTRDITVHAKRGTIFDRSGNVLAKSVEATTIYANPKEITNPTVAAKIIMDHIGGDEATLLNRLSNQSRSFVYIAQKVDPDQATDLKAALKQAQIDGIYYLSDTKRVYPQGQVAGQVIGVVGADNKGLSGLEKYYDSVLAGTDGEFLIQRGRGGQPIAGGVEKELPAVDGQDIIVSLDIDIQQQAEKSVQKTVSDWKAASGTAVVIDPTTGEILAVCSTPYLNPNDLSSSSSEALKLRAVADAYEPGSTFKPFTAAIGIDTGTTDISKSYNIPPSIKVGDHDVTDVDKHGYITLNLRDILRKSSNIGVVMVAREAGGDAFWSYVQKLKFGEKTNIDFGGETKGIVQQKENWNGSSLGSMAFGQGISISPIQMARSMSAIANEGLLRVPHFLIARGGETVTYPEPERVFKTSTAAKVADMMQTVVDEGTGKYGQIPGYAVSGKTGTAQRANPSGGGYIKNSYTANFIGFAPSANPRVLVYVVIEGTPDGYGGPTAGPPFREIMKAALKRLNVQPNDEKAFVEGDVKQRDTEQKESEIREDMLERTGGSQDHADNKESSKKQDSSQTHKESDESKSTKTNSDSQKSKKAGAH